VPPVCGRCLLLLPLPADLQHAPFLHLDLHFLLAQTCTRIRNAISRGEVRSETNRLWIPKRRICDADYIFLWHETLEDKQINFHSKKAAGRQTIILISTSKKCWETGN
jgi:hypothetical protein